jgi:hypothetical protein
VGGVKKNMLMGKSAKSKRKHEIFPPKSSFSKMMKSCFLRFLTFFGGRGQKLVSKLFAFILCISSSPKKKRRWGLFSWCASVFGETRKWSKNMKNGLSGHFFDPPGVPKNDKNGILGGGVKKTRKNVVF